MEIQGKQQLTLTLSAGETTIIDYTPPVPIECLNLSGGTVWMKWHDDYTPSVGDENSTPLPVGMSYMREGITKIGVIADATTVFVINLL